MVENEYIFDRPLAAEQKDHSVDRDLLQHLILGVRSREKKREGAPIVFQAG